MGGEKSPLIFSIERDNRLRYSRKFFEISAHNYSAG